MTYEDAVFVFDCKETAQHGVIQYSQVRDIFFDTIYEDPKVKAEMDQHIKNDEIEKVANVFNDAYPRLKQVLLQSGLIVIN